MAAVLAPPRREIAQGTAIDLLVLACAPGGIAGIDLASGALVRALYPSLSDQRFEPFDTVAATLGEQGDADPTQPEKLDLADLPHRTGHLRARRADRWLRPLDHPAGRHLLGCAGPTVPHWELNGQRPSMALVPARPEVFWAGPDDLRCRFMWRGHVHELPVTDIALAEALRGGASLARIIGGEPRTVLTALTPPRAGHCYKVAAAFLPR